MVAAQLKKKISIKGLTIFCPLPPSLFILNLRSQYDYSGEKQLLSPGRGKKYSIKMASYAMTFSSSSVKSARGDGPYPDWVAVPVSVTHIATLRH